MLIQLDHLRRVTEIEYQSMMADARPRTTVAAIEADILAHQKHVVSHRQMIREGWPIYRTAVRRFGFDHATVKSWVRSIRRDVSSIRYRLGLIAELNAAVLALEEGAGA